MVTALETCCVFYTFFHCSSDWQCFEYISHRLNFQNTLPFAFFLVINSLNSLKYRITLSKYLYFRTMHPELNKCVRMSVFFFMSFASHLNHWQLLKRLMFCILSLVECLWVVNREFFLNKTKVIIHWVSINLSLWFEINFSFFPISDQWSHGNSYIRISYSIEFVNLENAIIVILIVASEQKS